MRVEAVLSDHPLATMRTIEESQWRASQRQHANDLQPILKAQRGRRARAKKHPVVDFLFTYYSFRPGHLIQWSPGYGVVLENAREEFAQRRYWVSGDAGEDSRLSLSAMGKRQRREVFWIHELLKAVTQRRANFGCYGLHEWAMVYRQSASSVRHAGFPLRLSEQEIVGVVENQSLCCSHYDAFRFFTQQARPLNNLSPTLESRLDSEQPGCLHTNMDLYKWAYKLSPWISSDLLKDAFFLAMEIRELDMRASPYELSALGLRPVLIETAAGRELYEREQRKFAHKAEPIRERLLKAAGRLVACLEKAGRMQPL